jgi:hypothetical protein
MCFASAPTPPPPPVAPPPVKPVELGQSEDELRAKKKKKMGTRGLQIPILPRGTGFEQGIGIPTDSLGIRG